jgi:tetratricopeptide (TPR) repeat protein
MALLVCAWKLRVGPAALLAAFLYESAQHIRFQAVFAVLVVVLAGSLLPHLAELFTKRDAAFPDGLEPPKSPPIANLSSRVVALVIIALFTFLVSVRCHDLVSNRYYIDSGQLSLFGPGESWWFPERAMDFLEEEHLPANLFHAYIMGGFLTWRVGERYPDFADGRLVPFGEALFREQNELSAAPPDSAMWQKAADRWNINTIVFSLSRYAGLGTVPLADFCRSATWNPVYLDDVSILFVRNRPEFSDIFSRFTIHCDAAALAQTPAARGNSWRARAERFNSLMNSASIYYLLSRDAEAFSALQEAAGLFPDNPNLHLVTAQLLQSNNRFAEAEQEYLRAIRVQPGDAAWFALARLYNAEHRYADAVRCVKEAVSYSQVTYERYRSLGQLYISMHQFQDALAAFDRADRANPFHNDASDLGRSFNAHLAEGRARAYRGLNDLPHAVAQQDLAVRFTPEDSAAWLAMAELYQAQGNSAGAGAARQRAASLQQPTAASPASNAPER